MATKTQTSPTVPAAQASAIQQSIANIQKGINEYAASQGKTIQQNAGGGYTAMPSQAPRPDYDTLLAGADKRGTPEESKIMRGGVPQDVWAWFDQEKAKREGGKVDTTQPSPTTTKITPPSQASQAGQAGQQAPQGMVDQADQIQQGINSLASSRGLSLQPNAQGGFSAIPAGQQYKEALGLLTGSQQGSPATQGAAAAGVSSALQHTAAQTEPTSVLGNLQETDNVFDGIFTMFDDFMSPTKQKQSLVQEYEAMSSKLGIDSINTELVNTKKIIEGTEDDIRNEVTATGGFATDSQVLALANARNKSLIKNYNALLETRDNAMQQLNTMMQLSVQDRQFAEAEFDRKMNFGWKVAEFKQKASDNARQTYLTLGDKMGWDNMLASVTPYERSVIGKTLGVTDTALSAMGTQSASDRAMSRRKTEAEIQNLYSQIAERTEKNTVMVDTNGRVVVKPAEALKINKEVTGSDAYKSIRKAQDSLQFLNKFEQTFDKTGATSAVFSPRQNAKLKAEYNSAILNLKEFFNLGVLNGPDEAILKSVLPDPTNRSAVLPIITAGIYKPSASTKSGLDNMKSMIEATLDDRYKSLVSQYGDYSPESVNALSDLNRIYIEQKAKVNPEIVRMMEENPDLTIEDITQLLTQ